MLGNVGERSSELKTEAIQPAIPERRGPPLTTLPARSGRPQGNLPAPVRSQAMRHDQIDWTRVGGSVVVWLLIAAVVGLGAFALFEPGSIEALVIAEL